MSIRRPPAHYAASRTHAATLLARHDIPADDPCVDVLAVLLRKPGRAVAYIELRAETYPHGGLAVDRALSWLIRNGYTHLRELPLYGISYQSSGRCIVEVTAPPREMCEQRLQRA